MISVAALRRALARSAGRAAPAPAAAVETVAYQAPQHLAGLTLYGPTGAIRVPDHCQVVINANDAETAEFLRGHGCVRLHGNVSRKTSTANRLTPAELRRAAEAAVIASFKNRQPIGDGSVGGFFNAMQRRAAANFGKA